MDRCKQFETEWGLEAINKCCDAVEALQGFRPALQELSGILNGFWNQSQGLGRLISTVRIS